MWHSQRGPLAKASQRQLQLVKILTIRNQIYILIHKLMHIFDEIGLHIDRMCSRRRNEGKKERMCSQHKYAKGKHNTQPRGGTYQLQMSRGKGEKGKGRVGQ